MTIPNGWTLTLVREGALWTGWAKKHEGVRTVTITTYDKPCATFEDVMTVLEERIKL